MTHVVALSGGKDSTALAEKEPREYEYIYTPTDLAKDFAAGREIRGAEKYFNDKGMYRVCSI